MFRRARISASRRARVLVALLVALGAIGTSGPAAAAERLRVRARTSVVHVGTTRGAEWVEVTGGVRDDGDSPVRAGTVRVALASGGAVRGEDCLPSPGTPDESRAVARLDGDGIFCFRLPPETDLTRAAVRYDGNEFYEPTEATIPLDAVARELRLAFEQSRPVIDLDAPSAQVNVTTRIVDYAGSAPLRLVLSFRGDDEPAREVELGAAFVAAGSRATWSVETRLLAPPRRGLLIVRFAGYGSLAPAEARAPVEGRATAEVTLAAAPPPADPSDGVALLCGVTSAVGVVERGWVEATFEGRPVGMGNVSRGAARVVATFSPPRDRSAKVMLKYVPDDPGFVPGPPRTVEIPIAVAPPWRSAPWVLAAIAVGYWVVRAWQRPGRRTSTKRPVESAARGLASVEVLERGPVRSGWRGRVLDAHEATPISGARIRILVPSFASDGVVSLSKTRDDGSFDITHLETGAKEAARWEVTSAGHTKLAEPLPPEGTLVVCLVSRRRALLDRLVRWAARAGKPRIRGREPTPADVASGGSTEVTTWAAAVEQAAYGEIPPDERRESALVSAEPLVPERQPRHER